MLPAFQILTFANIIIALFFCCATVQYKHTSVRFRYLHILIVVVSSAEILYATQSLIINAAGQEFLLTISAQLIWSLSLLYQSCNTAKIARDNINLRGELNKHLNLYEEIKSIAMSDGLTNIANRRNFDMFLQTELKRAYSLKKPLSLIILDLDKFKTYNDAFGHLKGDKLLSQIGQILRQNVRANDLPARYGGEEFSIILPDADINHARIIAEKLRGAIAGSLFPGHDNRYTATITASFGVATYDPLMLYDQPTPEKIIAIADKALYRAKQEGRNRTHAFNIFQ